jgi:hypothetical protein
MPTPRLLPLSMLILLTALPALAQIDIERDKPCCDLDNASVVWMGADPAMTFGELAAHAAPILWFSPDEPLIEGQARPGGISQPQAFPFENDPGGPVVYYRIRNLVHDAGATVATGDLPRDNATVLDLGRVTAIDLDYFFYYPSEEGLGGHVHDVEAVEMKLAVFRQTDCTECRYGLAVTVINAKAHGILWYDNTLEVDEYTRFPATLLIEEGKHASCTDKNGDGYFTPGYDVNVRINDAWGVRDVMRTGALFTGGFQSWFAKVRRPEDRVFPPLPEDNRARAAHTVDGRYAPGYRQYELRPFPELAAAEASGDPSIIRFVDKGHPDWPTFEAHDDMDDLTEWLDTEYFAKSLSLAARYDGDMGLSMVFPLLVVKNINDPVTGGWLVNRIYLKDEKLRDFGWNIMYTTSASRWFDGYFSAGLEVDEFDTETGTDRRTGFVTETGIKLRGNISHSPLKFMGALTDFMGLRVGVRYRGFERFDEIGYVVEIGAGAF